MEEVEQSMGRMRHSSEIGGEPTRVVLASSPAAIDEVMRRAILCKREMEKQIATSASATGLVACGTETGRYTGKYAVGKVFDCERKLIEEILDGEEVKVQVQPDAYPDMELRVMSRYATLGSIYGGAPRVLDARAAVFQRKQVGTGQCTDCGKTISKNKERCLRCLEARAKHTLGGK